MISRRQCTADNDYTFVLLILLEIWLRYRENRKYPIHRKVWNPARTWFGLTKIWPNSDNPRADRTSVHPYKCMLRIQVSIQPDPTRPDPTRPDPIQPMEGTNPCPSLGYAFIVARFSVDRINENNDEFRWLLAGMWSRSRGGLESRDPLRPRSRLGQTSKRLGLGIKGLGLGIGLRQLGLVHIPPKRHCRVTCWIADQPKFYK